VVAADNVAHRADFGVLAQSTRGGVNALILLLETCLGWSAVKGAGHVDALDALNDVGETSGVSLGRSPSRLSPRSHLAASRW
jgi:hypothetical protein